MTGALNSIRMVTSIFGYSSDPLRDQVLLSQTPLIIKSWLGLRRILRLKVASIKLKCHQQTSEKVGGRNQHNMTVAAKSDVSKTIDLFK